MNAPGVSASSVRYGRSGNELGLIYERTVLKKNTERQSVIKNMEDLVLKNNAERESVIVCDFEEDIDIRYTEDIIDARLLFVLDFYENKNAVPTAKVLGFISEERGLKEIFVVNENKDET